MKTEPKVQDPDTKDAADALLIATLRAQLRADEQALDYTTAARLRAARARAVEAAAQPRGFGLWRWSAAVPVCGALVFALWSGVHSHRPARAEAATVVASAEHGELFDLVEQLGIDEPTLHDDNLDFALWLEDGGADAAEHGDS